MVKLPERVQEGAEHGGHTALNKRGNGARRAAGKYVGLAETIRGFQLILSGELDSLPEQAFYLVGNIDEASTKAITLEEENKSKK